MPGKLIPGTKKTPVYKKSSGFKMKGSPFHDHERQSEGWIIEHPNQTAVEVEKLKRENETEEERNKRIAKKYVTPAGAR